MIKKVLLYLAVSGLLTACGSDNDSPVSGNNQNPPASTPGTTPTPSVSLDEVAGVWYSKDSESELVIQVTADGKYLLAQPILRGAETSKNGMEAGTLTLNPVTGNYIARTAIDTNKDWGLNNTGEPREVHLALNGANLVATVQGEQGNAILTKVARNTSGIVGAWSAGINKPLFVFKGDNTYIMVDPIGDESQNRCGGPGVEYGKYSYLNGNLSSNTIMVDTNGCAGLADNGVGTALSAVIGANTLLLDSAITLNRQ